MVNKKLHSKSYLHNKGVTRKFAAQVLDCGRVSIANNDNKQAESGKVKLRTSCEQLNLLCWNV